MKAHELAKALLNMPDVEVFLHDEYSTEKNVINIGEGFQITPSGLFLQRSNDFFISDTIKAPSDRPTVGTMRIFLCDGEITSITNVDGYPYTVMNLEQSEITWHRSPEKNMVIFISENNQETNSYREIIYKNCAQYNVNDISYIQVLTSFDEDTWHETWQDMSFDDAVNFANKLKKVNILANEQNINYMKNIIDIVQIQDNE